MSRIKSWSLFESVVSSDKYLITLSSANCILGAKTWIEGTSPSITDRVKAEAEKRWSLYAMLNKITPPSRLAKLSNVELGKVIGERGVRPLRIREEYDDVCRELAGEFHRLFSGFKKGLKIDDKIEFMALLEEHDWIFSDNGDIIKVVDVEDLSNEIGIISDMFGYYYYPA